MSDILCITNRSLCKEDFLTHIEKIAAARPAGIILREKDLPEEEYKALANKVMRICEQYHTPCILHQFTAVAKALHGARLHLPLPILRTLSDADKRGFSVLGASCHSIKEVAEAQVLGCTYITAGHIFDTDCKKGVPCRGLDFLRTVCRQTPLPVYAIGGIDKNNIKLIRAAGAHGACVMSGPMICEDPSRYLADFQGENL